MIGVRPWNDNFNINDLDLALMENNAKMANLALSHPNILNYLPTVGEALMISASRGLLEIVEAIINQPYFNQIPALNRGSAMRFATQNNQLAVLSKLLDANCEAGVLFNVVAQCLILSTKNGFLNIAILLFDKKEEDISITHKKSALKVAIAEHIPPLIDFFKGKLCSDLGSEATEQISRELTEIVTFEMQRTNNICYQYAHNDRKSSPITRKERPEMQSKLSASL